MATDARLSDGCMSSLGSPDNLSPFAVYHVLLVTVSESAGLFCVDASVVCGGVMARGTDGNDMASGSVLGDCTTVGVGVDWTMVDGGRDIA